MDKLINANLMTLTSHNNIKEKINKYGINKLIANIIINFKK